MEYIFVVGLPRTGTKLVRNVIENAHDVHARISPETWFFGDLFRSGFRQKIKKFGDMRNDESVRQLIEYMFSGSIDRSYWQFIRKADVETRKSMFETALLHSDRSEKAIYDSILRVYASIRGSAPAGQRQIIGDKMPGNLYFVPTILGWFPDAKVIHTFRDPRAIMASELKKVVDKSIASGRFGHLRRLIGTWTVVLYVTVTWLRAAKLHTRYSNDFPGAYLLSKYEDLVSSPKDSVEVLCAFLEIRPNSEMLDPPHKDSSFDQAAGGHGFDAQGIDRWRGYLKPWIVRWLQFSTGRHWAKFGYEP